jgi:P4 family phage/plasmid primase-like protien
LHGIIEGRCACGADPCPAKAGKHPRIRWKTLVPGEHRHSPEEGYGIRTGADFGLFVVETDQKEGVDGEQNLHRLGLLPETYMVRTPSGSLHHYFRWPHGIEYLKSSAGVLAPGVDVRGSGGMVVGPGSPHRNGGVYEALGSPDAIAEAPEWLVTSILATEVKNRASSDQSNARPVDITTDVGRRYLASAAEFLATAPLSIAGEPDTEAIFLVVCRELVLRRRIPIETAAGLLEDLYNPRLLAHPTTPWEGDQLWHKLQEASNGTMAIGIPEVDMGPEVLARMDAVLLGHLNGRRVEAAVAAAPAGGEPPLMRGDHDELASRVEAKFAPLVFERCLYQYDPSTGIWDAKDLDGKITRYVRSFAGTTVLPQVLDGKDPPPMKIRDNDVTGVINLVRSSVKREGFFDDPPVGLACANGFVRLTEDGIHVGPHSPDNRVLISHSFAYSPEATAPLWDSFLVSLFRDDADREGKILLVEEFFGGALFGLSTRYQKCLVGTGGGSNGKSTLLEVVNGVFPKGSITGVSLKSLMGSREEYYMANLRGSALNVLYELPNRAISDTSILKSLIPGDRVSARDPAGKPFVFKPHAGHCLLANELPAVNDTTSGFWRKVIVLEFNRNYETDPNRIVDLASKILEADRIGILTRLARGALRLLHQGEYTNISSSKGALSAWATESDGITRFLEERLVRLEPSEKAFHISGAELYASYSAWAVANGEKPYSNVIFARRAKALGLVSYRTTAGSRYPARLLTSGPAFGAS